jgi:protocatechuate 3,4-dioxygenase beta subunit
VVRWSGQERPATAVPATTVRSGTAVRLAGRVTGSGGAAVAGLPVVLERAPFDGRTVPAETATRWTEAARTTTATDGGFRFGVAPASSSLFRARVPASARHTEVTSAAYPVAAQSPVRIDFAQSRLRTAPTGSKGRVKGRVRDSDGKPVAGLRLDVQRFVTGGKSWRPYKAARTGTDGSFAFVASSTSPALIRYRVRSASTGRFAATVSRTVKHEARHDPFDNAQLRRMVRSLEGNGMKVGVGLVDRHTGRTYNRGQGQSSFYTASVAKVMVAMDVLRDDHVRGRTVPTAATARKLQSMIRNSNDAITWSYWRSRGQSALVGRINQRCGTAVRVYNNTWSMSRPTPVQMAQVLDCLADYRALNAKLSDWLIAQMRAVTSAQRWGVPAANPDPYRAEANKNGWWRWPCCYFWTVNSTALFGPGNRYAFTVFTQYGGASPQSRGQRQAYRVAKAMYPWGTVIY